MFIFIVAKITATVLLINGVKDVEELTNAGKFVVSGKRIEFSESGFGEARFGREISWETNGAHAAAVSLKIDIWGKVVDWSFGGEVHVVAELKELFVEGGIVSEDADWVVVDFETFSDRFDDDGFLIV